MAAIDDLAAAAARVANNRDQISLLQKQRQDAQAIVQSCTQTIQQLQADIAAQIATIKSLAGQV